MRAETVELVKQAVSRRLRVYVLVNNRTEGNAPLTIQALVDMLRSDEISVPTHHPVDKSEAPTPS